MNMPEGKKFPERTTDVVEEVIRESPKSKKCICSVVSRDPNCDIHA